MTTKLTLTPGELLSMLLIQPLIPGHLQTDLNSVQNDTRDDCDVCGHPDIKTPNIDRLTGEGMMFHQAFLMTNFCSPSGASIITGTYPHQNRT